MPDNIYRVFPLPGIILFPGMLLPLRIFEERYQQLLEVALNDDRKIVMAMIKTNEVDQVADDPGVFVTAGLGEIIHCERLEDGTYRIILEGKSRLRLIREQPKQGLIRLFTAQLYDDELKENDLEKLDELTDLLMKRVRTWVEKRLPESVHESVLSRLDEAPTVGNRLDRVAALVVHVVSHRQALLETVDVYKRACILENLTRWAGTNGPFGHTTMN